MKKEIFVLVGLLIINLMIMGVYASPEGDYLKNHTTICGDVYLEGPENESYSLGMFEGAEVIVTCFHNNESSILQTQVTEYDDYCVFFEKIGDNSCNDNDLVLVNVKHSSLYGYGRGYVQTQEDNDNGETIFIDVAIIDVPLVPEFGLIIGGLTLISAIGIFFFFRR